MTVSIVVPMYNAERYIERCALSLFKQTYKDLQFIFIDDCSTDATVEHLRMVIDRFPERQPQVVLKLLESNGGVSHARQLGLDAATGEYVAQIDADDYIALNYVQSMVAAATEGDCDIVVCDYVYVYRSSQKQVVVNSPNDTLQCLARIISGQMHAGFMNKLIRRSLYVENHLAMVPGLNMLEDKTMMVKVFDLAKNVKYLSLPLYFYDKTNASSATSKAKAKQLVYHSMAWNEIEQYFLNRDLPEIISESIEFFRIGVLGSILYYSDIHNHQYSRTLIRRPSFKSIRRHPAIPVNYKLILTLYSLRASWLVALLRFLRQYAN